MTDNENLTAAGASEVSESDTAPEEEAAMQTESAEEISEDSFEDSFEADFPEADFKKETDEKSAESDIKSGIKSGIEKSLDLLSEKADELLQRFDKRIMYTEHERELVNGLRDELSEYKKSFYAQLLKPILSDLAQLRDGITRMSESIDKKPEGERAVPNSTFALYAYDIQDILEKYDVEIYRSETGDNFVPIEQRPLKRIVTDDPELHGRVAESMSSGYRYNGFVLSPEKVAVYKYEKPSEEET